MEYKEFFPLCTNLKGVSLSVCRDHSRINDNILESQKFKKASEEVQKIWKNRILYIKSLGIEILDQKETMKNGKLELKIAKELNLNWHFRFS